MSAQTTDTARVKASTDASPSGRARPRRLITALTVLAFLAIGAVALYAISLIIDAVVLLLLSALLAYLIYPLVQFLQRRLTRAPAIVIAYLLVASAFAVVMFIVVSALIQQSSSLAQSIQFLLSPAGERRTQAGPGMAARAHAGRRHGLRAAAVPPGIPARRWVLLVRRVSEEGALPADLPAGDVRAGVGS